MIKTLAVEINEATYPIAVACLGPEFALIKKKFVMGSYLVINDLQFPGYRTPEPTECDDEIEDRPRRSGYIRYDRMAMSRTPGLTLVNYWEPKKLFKKKFKIVPDVENHDVFFEIVKR